MLVHKGGKIKNWGGECRDVTKSLSQNIRVDVNRELFWGGGRGGQVRGGGVFGGGGSQGGCEQKFL